MRVEGVEALTIWCFWAFALMGQALEAIVFIVCAVPWLRAEAGSRPGGRPPFLCATSKEEPIRAPQSATPSRCEGANLRRGACGVRRITHCAPAALRSNKCGESVHEAGVSFGTPATPQAPRRRRSQKGWGRVGPSLRSALGSRAQAPRAGKPGQAQRWPVWDVGLLLFLVAPVARRGWRIRARDCLSAAGASLSETPPAPSTAGCPQRSAGTQTAGSPSLW